jgi:hypothetical protein
MGRLLLVAIALFALSYLESLILRGLGFPYDPTILPLILITLNLALVFILRRHIFRR